MKKIISFAILSYSIFCSANAIAWPEIKPINKQVEVNDPASVEIDIPIFDLQGDAQYHLMCRSGDYDDTSLFNFSGFLHCALFNKDKMSGTLFRTSNDSVEWENRGRFLTHHVLGNCGDVNEWGRDRTFELRNMFIQLKLDNLMMNNGNIMSYRFNVKVENGLFSGSLARKITVPNEPEWFYKGSCPKN